MSASDPQRDFDLIVIGGGSGGLAGAFRAAQHGARVALLEPHLLGGTCVNVGCVPKKAMWLAAEVAGRLRMARDLGFDVADSPSLDWPTFIAHRQRYIAGIHDSYRHRLDAAGIVLAPMRARFIDARTIECMDGVRLSASQILIATGGHPVRPDLPGAELGGVSDDFFQWTAAPARVAVVGGGYIGVELAGLLQALGSRVDLLVRGRLLDGFDVELVEQLAEDYRHAGVHIEFGHHLAAVECDGDGLRLRDRDGRLSEPYDRLLFATGRRANTASLDLAAAGVATDADGYVQVDERHATNVAGIHAVGDVTANLALTPVAIAAARRLMDRLYGGSSSVLDQRDIPTVTFSHPPLGKVGLTEAQARERHGDEVHVYRAGFRPMLHALANSPQRSLFKLVCVGAERQVVGLHLLGEAADEILQGYAVAIKRGITLDDLRETVAIHPTSAEEVVLMR
ncbi:glutathione-disulfide reductase [Lysobacter silvisoli]|uniref:Glutathione-disulfide reductase n=1 Tax=Lysobacter silvisoli TaxID=2293254 RepID=A0A371K5P5_9GAMM|nr:glutathione-disulfide reductase [Lysobacter silvisoli]RDZ29180.1 glutathione-disulfide reductase [Lysobacter silvisoli]